MNTSVFMKKLDAVDLSYKNCKIFFSLWKTEVNVSVRNKCFEAVSLDDLHPHTLKELAEVIYDPRLLIFNKSWSTRGIPGD